MQKLKIIVLLFAGFVALACTLTRANSAARLALDAATEARRSPTITAITSTPEKIKSCVVTAAQSLNVRASPGTGSAVIAVLNHGDVVTVIEDSRGVWIRVQRGDLSGWINSHYCERK